MRTEPPPPTSKKITRGLIMWIKNSTFIFSVSLSNWIGLVTGNAKKMFFFFFEFFWPNQRKQYFGGHQVDEYLTGSSEYFEVFGSRTQVNFSIISLQVFVQYPAVLYLVDSSGVQFQPMWRYFQSFSIVRLPCYASEQTATQSGIKIQL